MARVALPTPGQGAHQCRVGALLGQEDSHLWTAYYRAIKLYRDRSRVAEVIGCQVRDQHQVNALQIGKLDRASGVITQAWVDQDDLPQWIRDLEGCES